MLVLTTVRPVRTEDSMICGKMVRCWDNSSRPCVRHAGHTPGQCNPFSTDHPFDKGAPKKPSASVNREVLVDAIAA